MGEPTEEQYTREQYTREQYTREQYLAGLGDLFADPEPVELVTTRGKAYCLMCAVQLACRHPDFTGQARVIAESMARRLQQLVALNPVLADLAERGWDLASDVPWGGKD